MRDIVKMVLRGVGPDPDWTDWQYQDGNLSKVILKVYEQHLFYQSGKSTFFVIILKHQKSNKVA